MGWRKTQGNWVVEIGRWMPRIKGAGDICLRRPRPTQGCRANDDEDDDDDDDNRYHKINAVYSEECRQKIDALFHDNAWPCCHTNR
jgi:hypothetical protein